MSQTLELPDSVYDALKKAADATGKTPAEWIAARLPKVPAEAVKNGAKTAADLFAGRIGVIRSEGPESSEDIGRSFTEYVMQKKRDGVL